MNMRNSVLQALLRRVRLINEMRIVIAPHQYDVFFGASQNINHNNNMMESNQYDII